MTAMAMIQAASSADGLEHVPLSLPVPHVQPLSQQYPVPQSMGLLPHGLGVEGVQEVAPREEHSEAQKAAQPMEEHWDEELPQVLVSPHHHVVALESTQESQAPVLPVVPVPEEGALVGLGGKGDLEGVRERVTAGVGERDGEGASTPQPYSMGPAPPPA